MSHVNEVSHENNSIETPWTLLFLGVAAILTVNLGRLVYHGVAPLRARAASERPYTVVRTENGFDKDGNLRFTNHYLEAVRTGGSTMRRNTTSVVQQRRIDFANGDEVLTNEILGRKSTYSKKYSAVPNRRDPAASCYSQADANAGWIIDGTDSIDGYRTVRLSYAGAGRSWKIWYALDAACAVLETRYEEGNALTVQKLTSLTLAEPDPSLFAVSAVFQEVPPSGLYERVCKDGNCTAPLPDAQKQRLDKKYFDLRAQAR